jgi:hypothetical protein
MNSYANKWSQECKKLLKKIFPKIQILNKEIKIHIIWNKLKKKLYQKIICLLYKQIIHKMIEAELNNCKRIYKEYKNKRSHFN